MQNTMEGEWGGKWSAGEKKEGKKKGGKLR